MCTENQFLRNSLRSSLAVQTLRTEVTNGQPAVEMDPRNLVSFAPHGMTVVIIVAVAFIT